MVMYGRVSNDYAKPLSALFFCVPFEKLIKRYNHRFQHASLLHGFVKYDIKKILTARLLKSLIKFLLS